VGVSSAAQPSPTKAKVDVLHAMKVLPAADSLSEMTEEIRAKQQRQRSQSFSPPVPLTRESSVDDVQRWFVANNMGRIASYFLGMDGQQMLGLSQAQVRAYADDPSLGSKLWSLLSDLHDKKPSQSSEIPVCMVAPTQSVR
jgi:hypothetical protein